MGSHQPIRKIVTPDIPDKLYFRIGDVARICEVPAYVLRFWETEFPQLKPNKGGTGQRLYRKRDVEMALRIKSLLYEEGYTIPGARQVFKAEAKALEIKAADGKAIEPRSPQLVVAGATPSSSGPTLAGLRRDASLQQIRTDMASLLATLSKPVAPGSRETKVHAMRPRHAPETPSSRQLSLDGDLF